MSRDSNDSGGSGAGATLEVTDATGAGKKIRVRLNDAEKIWVVNVGMVTNCPMKNGRDLVKTVKTDVLTRLADLVTFLKQERKRECRNISRGGYGERMARINPQTIVNLYFKGVRTMRKSVKVVLGSENGEEVPQAKVRHEGKDGDERHQLDQLCLDWEEIYKKSLGGSDEGGNDGRRRVKKKKVSARETRKRMINEFENQAKKKKAEKETEKAEHRADREKFNTNIDLMTAAACAMASAVVDLTSAMFELDNWRM